MENYNYFFCPRVNEWSQNHYLHCCLCSWNRLLTHSGHTAGSHALLKQAGSGQPGTGVKGQQAGPEKCPQVSLRWLWDWKISLEVLRCSLYAFAHILKQLFLYSYFLTAFKGGAVRQVYWCFMKSFSINECWFSANEQSLTFISWPWDEFSSKCPGGLLLYSSLLQGSYRYNRQAMCD